MENARLWWNTWFLVQEIYLHSRQTSTRNEQIPRKSTRTQMDDQRKNQIDPKGPNDVENINSTNKGRDLLLTNKLRIIPWGTEGIPQRIQRHNKVTLHRSSYPKREQDRTEKCSYGLDWFRKSCDVVPQSWIINCKNMYKISDEVMNIIEKTMKTWRVELTAGERNLPKAKIQRGIFQWGALWTLLFITAM